MHHLLRFNKPVSMSRHLGACFNNINLVKKRLLNERKQGRRIGGERCTWNTGRVPSLPGKMKSNRDHNSLRRFCMGVPDMMILCDVRNCITARHMLSRLHRTAFWVGMVRQRHCCRWFGGHPTSMSQDITGVTNSHTHAGHDEDGRRYRAVTLLFSNGFMVLCIKHRLEEQSGLRTDSALTNH
jgi:hypothetical protein